MKKIFRTGKSSCAVVINKGTTDNKEGQMAQNNFQQKTSAKTTGFWGRTNGDRANPQQEKLIDFSLHAPDASSVNVVGSFNQWRQGSFRLQKEIAGIWKGKFALKPGVYEYRFIVNGQWADDPKATKTTVNSFGTRNAVLEVK
jgi:1,4-alpha-glucan branching enzyme